MYWLFTAVYDFSLDFLKFLLPTAQFHLRRLYICVWAMYFRIFEKPPNFSLPRTFFCGHCMMVIGHSLMFIDSLDDCCCGDRNTWNTFAFYSQYCTVLYSICMCSINMILITEEMCDHLHSSRLTVH
jgi:hypothetical protein